MQRRARGTIAFLLCGLVIGGVQVWTGSVAAGVVLFLLFAALALVASPVAFPRALTDAEARSRSAADGRPIVYWRPGCPFCLRLRTRLGRDARRAHWVDIWADRRERRPYARQPAATRRSRPWSSAERHTSTRIRPACGR